MRVLVLEDEPSLRESLVQRLRGEGYVVDAAADGIEGEYAGREFPLDAAIVDLGLPGRRGSRSSVPGALPGAPFRY
jgi:two-component system, OmpR family, response regulator PhoP